MLVYEWILSIGGLEEMKRRNLAKANVLYGYLDSQDYYIAPVEKSSRSMMNVTFVTGDADLDKKFAAEASAEGLVNLKGHRLSAVCVLPFTTQCLPRESKSLSNS